MIIWLTKRLEVRLVSERGVLVNMKSLARWSFFTTVSKLFSTVEGTWHSSHALPIMSNIYFI